MVVAELHFLATASSCLSSPFGFEFDRIVFDAEGADVFVSPGKVGFMVVIISGIATDLDLDGVEAVVVEVGGAGGLAREWRAVSMSRMIER